MAAHSSEVHERKDLGFDRDNILYFPSGPKIDRYLEAFKKSLLENPKVISVAQSRFNPMAINNGMVLNDTAWPGKTAEDNISCWNQCDPGLHTLVQFRGGEGPEFFERQSGRQYDFIINEEAAKQMRLTDPIGQSLLLRTKERSSA